ncbi:uncharacterized protein TNCV_1055601 [Trichonephila clavipes]|nr:uncharacterized protein TNCV_1055601 [Trichonephila clavipes]
MASSTECPLFPKPKKGKSQPQKENKKRNEITQANAALIAPGLSFAQAIQGKNSQQRAARGNDSSASDNDNNNKFNFGDEKIFAVHRSNRQTPLSVKGSPYPNPLWNRFTLDYALIKNLNWPCTADSLAELSSDHNPIRFYFQRTPKFEIPPPQLNTTWSIFTKFLANPDNFDLPKANSTQEIDSQVSNLTTEILNAHSSASRPFYHSEQPYVQGELKELIKRA